MSNRVVIIYRGPEKQDRWIEGDHKWRGVVRRAIRGPDPIGGIDLVFLNLCAGLDQLKIDYVANPPLTDIRPSDWVGAVGRGKACLAGYKAPNPLVTGVAVAAHPAEWPTLFEDYPVAFDLVHCDWVKAMYDPWYGGSRVRTWPVGIDTDRWVPASGNEKSVDLLIYDKIRWDPERVHNALLTPITAELDRQKISYDVIRYGSYKPAQLEEKLRRSRAFLFLCEHETQGLAYQQAMSAGLPVLAWDPGQWLDAWRYQYGETYVPATSVPFFDERCGMKFHTVQDFPAQLGSFLEKLRAGYFKPREYILETLTLAGCSRRYLDILRDANC